MSPSTVLTVLFLTACGGIFMAGVLTGSSSDSHCMQVELE